MHALPLDPQRLPARDEHMGLNGIPKDSVDQSRNRVDDLLAVVEHDKDALVAKKIDNGVDRLVCWQGEAQCRCEGANHERRVFDRRQIDEQRRIAETAAQGRGGRDRQGRLADAGGTGNGYDAPEQQFLRDRSDTVGTADDRGAAGRQIASRAKPHAA
jgi:hypothetical protein